MTQLPDKLKDSLIVRPGDGDWYTITEPGKEARKYIRVTHPLSYWVPPRLKNWMIANDKKVVEERKETTANQGKEIHRQAENGTEDRLNTLLHNMRAITLATEVVVWSKNGWAGSLDRIIELEEGRKYAIDLKTGSFGLAWPQLGAYTLAANEHGLDLTGMAVISLPRDPDAPARFFDYTEHMEGGQLAYCQLFDFWKRTCYKELKGWEFFKPLATFSYQWSPELLEEK